MTYVVDAPLVLARDQEGRVHHRYQGAVVEWLDNQQAKHFVELGLVHKVGNKSAPTGEDELVLFPEGVEEYATEDVPPARVSKGEFVDFAVSKGADEEAANELNKDDLRAELLANASDAE
jgi:hypothetical protein